MKNTKDLGLADAVYLTGDVHQNLSVDGDYVQTNGDMTLSSSKSFAWSGIGEYNIPESRSEGTFNINAQNGLSGLYIGHKPMSDLALTYQKFLEFTYTGTLGVQLTAGIADDTCDGGFYGMCYAGNGKVILGTYQSGIYFYDEAKDTIVPAQLTAIDPSISGLDLETQKICFSRYRFRRVVKGENGFLAVNYQSKINAIKTWDGGTLEVPEFENKYHRCFYWSADGYSWTLVSYEESDSNNTRIESPLIYAGGKFYYAPTSGLFCSTDNGKTWNPVAGVSTYVIALIDDRRELEDGVIDDSRAIMILENSNGATVWYLNTADNSLVQQPCVISELSGSSNCQSYTHYADEEVAMFAADNYTFIDQNKTDKFKNTGQYLARKVNVPIDDYTKKTFKPHNNSNSFSVARGFSKAHDLWFLGTYHGYVQVSLDLKTWFTIYYEPLNAKDRGGIEGMGIYDQQLYYQTRCTEAGYPILRKLYVMNDIILIRKILLDYYTKSEVDAMIEGGTGGGSIYIDKEKAKALSIIHTTYEDYANRLTAGTVLSNEQYVLDSDTFTDVYGRRLINVAEPLSPNDAVPQSYLSNYVNLTTNQTISGYKTFKDGLDIGQYIEDVGNNCLAVGNDLTVGSYNFFYKGIDLSTTGVLSGYAKIYLAAEQPRYPYPFVVYNGQTTKFRMGDKLIDADLTATLSGLSTNNATSNIPKIWNCQLDPDPEDRQGDLHVWRADYNQLCADLGPQYWNKPIADIQNAIKSYLTDAFTGDDKIKSYLSSQSLVGQVITMVNGDKIKYLRCGKVVSVINDNVLCVNFKDTSLHPSTYNDLSTKGSHGFSDFDYDDASLVFIDKPLMKGPANVSTYSSLNVGILNNVSRRGSLAVGKQNRSEADFGIVFGRKGTAKNYCSFLWSPAKQISTQSSYTFNIGLYESLANAHLTTNSTDIQIIGSDNKAERLYKYVWGCISSDATLKQQFKNWLNS